MARQIHFPPELLDGIRNRRNDEVKAMLNEDLAKTNNSRGTLLHYAITFYNVEIISHLIELGSNIDELRTGGVTPLVRAVIHNLAAPAKLLLQAGADINIGHDYQGRSILQMVFGEQARGSRLIEVFIDEIVRTETADTEKIVDKLIALGSTMYHAACTRDIKVMEGMLDRGFDINSTGDQKRTALHAAAELADLDFAKWLILKGADVNALDNAGYTPLTSAAISGDIDMIKLLMNEGADPNAKCPKYWTTPLYAIFYRDKRPATEEQYDACTEYLLRNGAIPQNIRPLNFPVILNLRIEIPQTMLDHALVRKNDNRAKLLICHVVMLELLGTSITKLAMRFTLERYRSKMDYYMEYYQRCKQLLTVIMFDKLTLIDLLKDSDQNKMRLLVRNETFVPRIKDVCTEHELSTLYPYYYNMLMDFISKAEQLVVLEEASISIVVELSKDNFNHYFIAREIVSYLNEQELEQLRRVCE